MTMAHDYDDDYDFWLLTMTMAMTMTFDDDDDFWLLTMTVTP